MKKKLILLLVVLLGIMPSATATTKRVFVKCENSTWRDNASGLYMHIWGADASINNDAPGEALTRIASSEWYYIDIDSESSGVYCQFVTNTSGSYWYTNDSPSMDMSKNKVIYINSDVTPNVYVNDFDGYSIATDWQNTTKYGDDLDQTGLTLQGTLDFTSEVSDVYFRIFPNIFSESDSKKYYIGDLAIVPNQADNYAISSFVKYSESYALRSNDKGMWKETAHQKYNISIDLSTGKITLTPFRTATIGDAGYATWSNGEKYEVEGATDVYTVSSKGTDYVTLTSVKDKTYPAGTGLILAGSGDVKIKAVASDASTDDLGTNYLVGSGNSSTTPSTGDDIYVFSWDGSTPASVGFYKASSGTLAAHKAYLDLSGAGAREFLAFNFDDENTGIHGITNNVDMKNGQFFNLAGQRVAQPTKGLYIVNGKKVIMK